MTLLACPLCQNVFDPSVIGDVITIMCNDCVVVALLSDDAAA